MPEERRVPGRVEAELVAGSMLAAIAGGGEAMQRYDWYGGEESERNPDAEAEGLKAKVHAGLAGSCGLLVLATVAAVVALVVVVVGPVWMFLFGRV
ncbi:hypothetical protein [Streptomyces anulatus]|uniref:hypothetical protein n=2 Tax=Streptomyces anulatus TaxID=1892 RepID=UPI00371201EB